MSRKPYPRYRKPEMPLWRVVVASKARPLWSSTFYIVKFPLKEREAAVLGVIMGCEAMLGVKCFVLEQG